MVIGSAETLARAIGEALYEPEHGAVRPRATIGLSSLAELLRAVTGLSASPARIGALITLLVGSGAAASTRSPEPDDPPASGQRREPDDQSGTIASAKAAMSANV